ncbi:MAG: hypothetical protein HYT80_03055 [Euryarchaeota archaeon]|nr:hypothetical protein [Euryarchaeota archaeon]
MTPIRMRTLRSKSWYLRIAKNMRPTAAMRQSHSVPGYLSHKPRMMSSKNPVRRAANPEPRRKRHSRRRSALRVRYARRTSSVKKMRIARASLTSVRRQ